MKNPARTNFSLKKLKLINGGGISVKFELSEVVGGETYKSNQTHETTKEPHPDLVDKISEMRAMVAQVIGYKSVLDVAESKEFKGDVAQVNSMKILSEKLEDRVKVTGFALSGEDKTFGIVITTSLAVDNGQRSAFNTPRILLGGESRGFEEKLDSIVSEIGNEVYELIYNNKVANPEMFEYDEV